MTKEERAIEILCSYLPKDEPMNAEDREAFFIAIEALKREPILEKIKAEINTEIQAHSSPKDDVFFCLDYVCKLIDEKIKEYTK